MTDRTPHVRIDVEVLDANITAMQSFCDNRGIALRPHVKTHKSLVIARRQLDAGAHGLTVATLGEAEVFAAVAREYGVSILVAYPALVDADRLRALTQRVDVIVGADSEHSFDAIAGSGAAISIEIDTGLRRSGVAVDRLDALVRAAHARDIPVEGVFSFPGHGYSAGSGAADAARDEAVASAAARDVLHAGGVTDPVLSGGCTPTAAHTDATVVTELRPGVYALMDAQQRALGVARDEDLALTVRSSVVSTAVRGSYVLDAGAKLLGLDSPAYVEGHGWIPSRPGDVVARLWEHHAVVTPVPGSPLPSVGDRIDVVPNHVCATVNLVDELHTSDGGVWPVDARGRNT
ncbi:D-TA family PLP-dependent enzyme [Rhodococcus rhodnii]|uniref:D-serine dehydratase-like domain-containing protein n=2 Tax=Rhodococcus rhodnii TaxID=38312 RepID=R7WST3_9NOCA|nr:alanine racemase [Rhodococcus rhodnii]EOM78326.1 hypothetical protein Rrhod_0154 [Rhodococcus rhodnii LMG 5362]TXG91167.1 D-TA family PLP-dependent enzyme [Rhodococcus rhodnii]